MLAFQMLLSILQFGEFKKEIKYGGGWCWISMVDDIVLLSTPGFEVRENGICETTKDCSLSFCPLSQGYIDPSMWALIMTQRGK